MSYKNSTELSEYDEEQNKSPGLIKIIAEAGVNINCKDAKGHIALKYSLEYNSGLYIIKDLVSIGVRVYDKDDSGNDAFYYADYKNCYIKEID